MTHRFIIDTHALRYLSDTAGSDLSFFEPLTELVNASQLSFPHAVVKDCKKFCREETLWVWVNVAEKLRLNKGDVKQSYTELVLDKCFNLFDEDDLSEDQSPVRTAAMGLHFQELYGASNVTVVTEDRLDHPLRMNLHAACGVLGLTTLSAAEFLAELV